MIFLLITVIALWFLFGSEIKEFLISEEKADPFLATAIKEWDYVCVLCSEQVKDTDAGAMKLRANEVTKSTTYVLGHKKCITDKKEDLINGTIDYKKL